jgi:hypothetical protein
MTAPKKPKQLPEKTLFESKSFWGILVAVLAFVLDRLFDLNLSQYVPGIDNDMLMALGLGYATFGTIKRKSTISGV